MMKATFNEIWENSASSTWGACLHFTDHNHYDAEDLMQTTWLKTYTAWKQNPKTLTKAYFTTVAKNIRIDEIRKRKLPTISFDENYQHDSSFNELNTPLHFVHLLDAIVAKLTIRQQVLFLLSDVCHCNLKEIAFLTDMTVGAVKAALFRARQKIVSEVRTAAEEDRTLDKEEILRVQVYSRALQHGDVQLLARLLTDTVCLSHLFIHQQQQSPHSQMAA